MEVNTAQLESQDNSSEEDYDEYDDYDDEINGFETNDINKHSENDNVDWKFMPQVELRYLKVSKIMNTTLKNNLYTIFSSGSDEWSSI